MSTYRIVPAGEIQPGDVIRGYFNKGVTVETAELPGPWTRETNHDLRPGCLARPYRATVAGAAAVVLRSGRKLTADEPVLITA